MFQTMNLAVSCALLALLGTAYAASCPEVTADGPTCLGSADCTELQCQLPATGVFVNGTSSISLDPCDDPPLVNLTLQLMGNNGGSMGVTYLFRETGTVQLMEQVNITATVERNATSLAFLARSGDGTVLIPWVQYDINTTECLCSSMEELAEKIHSPFEHDCSTTPSCDGVTCQLDVLGSSFIVEMDVLSCATPPGVDVVVKDSQGEPFYSGFFTNNTTDTIFIAGFPVPMNVFVIQRPYSIEVESNVTVVTLGTFTLVPRHTIPLDLSSCSPTQPTVTPPTVAPTTPPTLPPPPPDAPPLCHSLYNLANMTGAGLNCLIASSCTSLTCELNVDGYFYQINLIVLPRENSVKAQIFYQPIYYYSYYSYYQQKWEVKEGNQQREFEVGPNSTLLVQATATTSTLTFQMVLRVTGQQDRDLILPIPINLPSAEGCLWWLPAVENLTKCSYLLDCQGVQCENYYSAVETASIFIDTLCADPIPVQLKLEDQDGVVTYQGDFTESRDFQPTNGMYTGYVFISRNDTELSLSVYTAYYYSEPLVPPMTIRLDQHACSCQSLAELAEKTQSPLEHNCTTNEACNGIRCEFDIFGTTFRLETILLSCNNPPALETLVEDENNTVLHTGTMSRTGRSNVTVLGLLLPLYADITHHNYSMDVSVSVFTPIYGNSTLIPPHTLFLDRSSCPTPITPPTTPSPPTSPTYPKPATPTCTALINIAKDNAQEPFVCEVSTSTGSEGECDTLVCRLDVRRSSFTVTLELYPRGGRYAASVKVDSTQIDSVLTDTQVTKNDSLSVSMRPGRLMFDFKSPPGNVLGIKVTVTMRRRTLILIDSEVPLEEEKGSPEESSSNGNAGVKIGVPVVVILLCVAASVAVVVLTGVWLWKRRQRRKQFDFKPMKFSELQDSPQREAGGVNETPQNTYEQVDATTLTSSE